MTETYNLSLDNYMDLAIKNFFSKMNKNDQSCNSEIETPQRNKKIHRGVSIYYVRVFWGALEPPTILRKDILLHKVRKNCHFLNHAPPLYPYVIYKCSLVYCFQLSTHQVSGKYLLCRFYDFYY